MAYRPLWLHWRDFANALALLTRLPAPGADGAHNARSVWAWPLVGAVVGVLATCGALSALWIGASYTLAAGGAIAIGIIVTGALHEDGLADVADGIGGGATPKQRLDIMRDSRIGSFGVIALALTLGLKWDVLVDLFQTGMIWQALIIPAMISRAAMAITMANLPFARTTGLAHQIGHPDLGWAGFGAAISIFCAMIFIGTFAIIAALVAGIIAFGMGRLAHHKIGGQTGDVLGATQILTETGILITFSIWQGSAI